MIEAEVTDEPRTDAPSRLSSFVDKGDHDTRGLQSQRARETGDARADDGDVLWSKLWGKLWGNVRSTVSMRLGFIRHPMLYHSAPHLPRRWFCRMRECPTMASVVGSPIEVDAVLSSCTPCAGYQQLAPPEV